jgi:hypothetical protein
MRRTHPSLLNSVGWELTMRNRWTKNCGHGLAVGLCVLAVFMGLQIQAVCAQDAAASNTAQKPMYYVDFRARTAASYGHAFVWYGRTGQRAVEVAGLHPASESVIPYVLGHIIPVPSETGASYGDLDEQYLTASYRVLMDEAQARQVFAYIKHLQASSPVWNAAAYNCVAFIQDIARNMGLRVPNNHVMYPEDWVNSLRALNGGGRIGRMPSMQTQSPATQAQARRPSAPSPAQARRPSAPSPAQTAEARARPE